MKNGSLLIDFQASISLVKVSILNCLLRQSL